MYLTDVLDRHGIHYRRHGEDRHVSEGWIGVPCPECDPGRSKFKMGINLASLKASCWNCGGQSTAWLLHLLSGLPAGVFKEELQLVDRIKARPRSAGRLRMPEGTRPMTNLHMDYLRGRGLDPYEVERLWKVQGTDQTGEPFWHLIIPVHVRKEVVSWTARSLSDQGRRYDTARDDESSVPIKQTLYGEDYAGNSIIACEGPLDVWAVGPGAVCTYGTAYTASQVLRLARYPKRCIVFDNEPDALRRAWELAHQLACYEGETNVIVLDAKDACSSSPSEKSLLRKELE